MIVLLLKKLSPVCGCQVLNLAVVPGLFIFGGLFIKYNRYETSILFKEPGRASPGRNLRAFNYLDYLSGSWYPGNAGTESAYKSVLLRELMRARLIYAFVILIGMTGLIATLIWLLRAEYSPLKLIVALLSMLLILIALKCYEREGGELWLSRI